jgi:ATP-dependent DNA ligase
MPRVQLCAFDVLALNGEDLRKLPLSMRKTNLERLLRGLTLGTVSDKLAADDLLDRLGKNVSLKSVQGTRGEKWKASQGSGE